MKKGILFLIGLVFVFYLGLNFELYGTIKSIQFWSLMGLSWFLIICLIFSSKIKNKIDGLSKKDVVKIYCSSSIQVLIGVIGVVAIVLSILYGAYMNVSVSEQERIKLLDQNFIWFLFTIYFVITIVFIFIRPLIKRLSSFK